MNNYASYITDEGHFERFTEGDPYLLVTVLKTKTFQVASDNWSNYWVHLHERGMVGYT